MPAPLPSRRLTGGMPGMLLAALVLLARLVVPPAALAGTAGAADALSALALRTVCHAGPQDQGPPDRGQAPATDHGACQLCPSCHLTGLPLLPAPGGAEVVPPARALIGLAAPPPPATGPPGRPRRVAQPTGPPTLAV